MLVCVFVLSQSSSALPWFDAVIGVVVVSGPGLIVARLTSLHYNMRQGADICLNSCDEPPLMIGHGFSSGERTTSEHTKLSLELIQCQTRLSQTQQTIGQARLRTEAAEMSLAAAQHRFQRARDDRSKKFGFHQNSSGPVILEPPCGQQAVP